MNSMTKTWFNCLLRQDWEGLVKQPVWLVDIHGPCGKHLAEVPELSSSVKLDMNQPLHF